MAQVTSIKAASKPDTSKGEFVEIGKTGLPAWSGMIKDAYQKELVGVQGRNTLREMTTDPTVGAALGTINQMTRSVPTQVMDGTDDNEGRRAGELVRTALADMAETWANTETDINTQNTYGWYAAEPVYKVRNGDADPMRPSRFNDGLVGWHKFAPRRQESLHKWEFTDAGDVAALWQQVTSPRAETIRIPADRLLLFRTESNRGNPEGKSLQLPAYIPWYCAKRVRVFEGIGIERELVGIPLLEIPGAIIEENGAAYQSYASIGQKIRLDEHGCVIIPSDRDSSGNPAYTFKLVSSGGSRKIDTNVVLQRYAVEILMTMYCDFLILGHSPNGSRSLADSKTSITSLAIAAWKDGVIETLNRYAIPRLMRLNGFTLKTPPYIKRGDVESPDLAALGAYVQQIGAVFPEAALVPGLMDACLTAAHLPTSSGAQDVGKRAAHTLNNLGLDDVRKMVTAAKEVQIELKRAREKPRRTTERRK